jgi:hypothetical protein
VAFPPNYRLERNTRARAKAQKALDKRLKREEKLAERKVDQPSEAEQAAASRSDSEQR